MDIAYATHDPKSKTFPKTDPSAADALKFMINTLENAISDPTVFSQSKAFCAENQACNKQSYKGACNAHY